MADEAEAKYPSRGPGTEPLKSLSTGDRRSAPLLFRNEYIVFRVLIIMIHINLITPILIRMHTSHRTIIGNLLERMISIELIHLE